MRPQAARKTLQDIAMRHQRGQSPRFAFSEQIDTPKSKPSPAYSDIP
jgi:hypothetical protein